VTLGTATVPTHPTSQRACIVRGVGDRESEHCSAVGGEDAQQVGRITDQRICFLSRRIAIPLARRALSRLRPGGTPAPS
jgi:hypothetical protein